MLKFIFLLILTFLIVSIFRFLTVLYKAFSVFKKKDNFGDNEKSNKKFSGKAKSSEKVIELDKDQYHVE